jgi:hypothetical protein
VRRQLLVVASALGALLIAAPVAAAATQTASSGTVSATFTYSGHAQNYSHERLTIKQSGVVFYSQPVPAFKPLCVSQPCGPASIDPHHPSVHVLDLEHNGEPNVVLDLYSGGAHCCWIEEVFSFDPGTMTYVETGRDFGNFGDQIKDLGHNGQLEFLTADDSFAYTFQAYAASGLPIQIVTFSGHRFHDVTRSYPKQITKDAALWLGLYKRHMSIGEGFIAAWAADEDLLGHSAKVKSYLNQEARAGHLKGIGYPSGMKFVNQLQKFLRKHGYVK